MRQRARRSLLAMAALGVVFAVLLAGSSQAVGTVLIGDQTVEPKGDSNAAGLAEAFQATATASGTLAKLTVYVDTGSTATSLVAGIYADSAGHPGPLLGQGTLNAPTAGAWNDVALNGVPVIAGTPYWIALLGPSGTLKFRDRCCGGGTAAETNLQTSLSALPATWTTGGAYKDGPFSAYGTAADSPVLVVNPTSLSFSGSVGGPDPATQSLGISNGGTGTLGWSISSNAAWLGATPASGTGPVTATVAASVSGLAAGTYSGALTVTATGAQGSPQTVNVSLKVTAPDGQPPTPPSSLGVSVSGSSASLSWGASTDNVGVTGYTVYRSTSSGFTPSPATLIGQTASLSYTDTGLAAGQYYYLVTAQDAAGNASQPSNQASATVTSPPPSAFLFGDQGIEPTTDSNPVGAAEAFKTTASAAGTLSTLNVYVDPTSNGSKLTAGVYADSGGHPGALLAQGTLTSPVAGAWNVVSVGSAQITSGATYWIGVLGPAGSTGTLRFRDRAGTGSAESSSQTSLASLPATWTTGASFHDGPLSAWGSGPVPSGPPPDQVGQWSAPVTWPLVAVHMTLLPTGNVLAFDAWSDAPNSQRIWNPTTGTFVAVPYGANLFCSGHILLPDGRTLVVGGNVQADVGIKDATLFDPSSNSWSKAADMSVARWYPTATVLGNGKVLVFGGDSIVDFSLPFSPPYFKEASQNSLPSVFDPSTNTWTDLTQSKLTTPLYPFMFQLSDGRILDAGPDVTTRVLNPGTWTWSSITTSPFDGGSAVMYLPDKIMKAGSYSNPDYFGSSTYQASPQTAVIDMSQANPTWRQTAPMSFPRTYQNMTLLPDGTVLASGGMTTSDGVDLTKAVLPAEIWNPTTETWTTVASLTTGREYHSTALLLPDGRVLMAGGGQLPGRATNINSAEIYSPPYLFKGARPTIGSAPSIVNYGSSFTISTPDAAGIQKVALVRTPSVTHAFDQNQRYIPLSFTRGSGQLTVQAPSGGNTAPPGYYMLFILNGSGVPSVASFIRFPAPWEDAQPPTAPGSLSATAGSNGTVGLSWSASSDNIGVTAYDVYRSTTSGFTPSLANRIAQTGSTSYQDAGLATGTYFYVVKAEDAAANLSPPSNQASATVAGDTTAPGVSLTAPANGATVSGVVTVSANATDNVGVAGVQFKLDGQNLGAEDTTSPYSISWDTSTASNGTHALTAVARDAAGNTTTSAAVSVGVQNAAPPPTTFLLGDQAIEAKGDQNPAGLAEAFQWTSGNTGTVTRLSVYVDASSTATKISVGLYTDNAGHPGTLLGQGTISSPTGAAWNDVAVSAAAVVSGTKYWIALLGPNGSGTLHFRDRCCGGGTGAETSSQTTLTALPATWTPGTHYSDGPASTYAAGTIP
ncbi:MAG: galactose oxidase-like domain-containing protein [Gaiellaceae bacterium]